MLRLDVELAPVVKGGLTPQGVRRILPIVGGLFSGSRLRGITLPRWSIGTSSGRMELPIYGRYEIKTDDGVVISVINEGLEVEHRQSIWQRYLFLGKAGFISIPGVRGLPRVFWWPRKSTTGSTRSFSSVIYRPRL